MVETAKPAPLEDLMVAMDVVDTLRHRQQLIDRELDADARRERLIEKLREIYRAQGLEVTDQMLADGVQALEEDRFKYTPPEKSFATWLAGIYVSRDSWLKPVLISLALLAGLWIFYYTMAIRPEKAAQEALPEQLTQRYGEVIQIAQDQTALTEAQHLQTTGKLALENNQFDEASDALTELDTMLVQLKNTYEIRIVQRPGENSGVWRIPDVNSQARNYYLIVEAVDARNSILSLPITNEETGQTSVVDKWGLRVDSTEFERVAADKQDDGIIQNRIIGHKSRGKLNPEYLIPTNGATITDW